MNAATASRTIMSSIDNGPFLEENDVSRQVDKSIYVEELINDGQTQRTEQTLASCTTVRTEYTASASTEDNYSTSDTISSSPSEVQLSFNTSLSLTATSSNNYPIPEIYDESLLEKDFSDEEIELPTNSLSERNYINPNLNLLEIYDPKACYNKFLYYHRLQALPSPQTVGSFLHYIQEYYPMFYSNQYIKISIKPHSRFDHIFTEAHIYLPYENFIPDHIIFPPFEDLLYYSDVELKSPNNKFQTPTFTDSLFFSTPNLQHYTTLNPNTNTNSISDIQTNMNNPNIPPIPNQTIILEPEYISIPIKIASLNTNGLLQPTKKLLIEETLNQKQYDILGLLETHLTQKDGKFLNNKIKNYTSFWSSFSNPHQAGVGIFIHNKISKYVARIHNFNGHIIGLDLHFKNTPIRLLQIYIPTTEKKQLRKEIQEQIITMCQNTKYRYIIMGDFNSVPNPRIDRSPSKKTSIPETQLIKYLISHQYKDIYRFFFPNSQNFTFQRSNIQSRIDQIWTNLSITNIDYTDILSNNLFESDHNTITLELSVIINKPKPRKQHKRKKFLWKNSSKKDLENYANQTTLNLQKLYIQIDQIVNQNQLNNFWNKLQKTLIKAATKHIPFHKINTIKEIKETSTSKQTPLFYRFKEIQYLKNHFSSPNFLSLCKKYISQYSDCLFQLSTPTLLQIKEEFQQIKTALNIQQQQTIYKEIQQKIEIRNKSFLETPKLFYKKILEKYNNIHIDRLSLENSLLTEHNEILNAIHNHFTEYFKEKPLQPILPSSEFYYLYEPHPEYEKYYNNLFQEITNQEWQDILTNLPNQKAAGPSEICYEHIKYASHKAQTLFKKFFNKCFQLQKVPTDWKSSNIFLIPKKSNWDFTLNQVRPISIIEPFKKTFTKIFTKRLNQIISNNHLLSNLNFAASKNSLTHIPIQILHNTIEHYKIHNKEAWILFQDMSKAFDKINISRLQDTCKRIGIPNSGINLITELHSSRQARIITAHGLTSPINIQSGIEQGETYSPLL